MIDVIEAIQTRTSANQYDPQHVMSYEDIASLVELATHAPTSFNQQNWRCIAVSTPEMKSRLRDHANGQAKIADAAVTFVMIGDILGYEKMAEILKPSAGAAAAEITTYENRLKNAHNLYANNSSLQRDEAIRSASLVGMTLMLAAQGKGYVSCPMIGFDANAVAQLLELKEEEVPVMLITVGLPAEGNLPRKIRRSVSDVLTVL